MSATIINLNKARKAKARGDASDKAAMNRARYGRTKSDKQAHASSVAKAGRELDGHKRVLDPD